MNIYSKENRSIAVAAAKVMQEQPAKVQDFKPTAPLNTDMVDRVLAAGMGTVFKKSNINESVSSKKKAEKKCDCDDSCSCETMKESNFEELQSSYGADRPSISNAAATLMQAKKNKSKKLEEK